MLLAKFKKNVTILILTSGFFETIFFFDSASIFATAILITGWYMLKVFVLTDYNLKYYPVSFIMMLGYAIFGFILPLPLTILDLSPITFNLRVPYLTFSHHLLITTALVLAFKAYTIVAHKKNIFRTILKNTVFYVEPTNRVIWISALMGLAAGYYNYFVIGIWQLDAADRTPIYYVNTLLTQFVWMPIILLFGMYRSGRPPTSVRQVAKVIIYSLILLLMAVASNWRTIVFSGIFLSIGLFGFGLLLNHYDLRKILSLKRIFLYCLIFFSMTGPLVDLAASMVVVRSERTSLSALEFLDRTAEEYNNKKSINIVKDLAFGNGSTLNYNSFDWSEHYLNNIVLNRLVNFKISDNCLFYASQIGFGNASMQNEMVEMLAASMPSAVISLFGGDPVALKANKRYSIGDYLYSLAINNTDELGSAKISSMPGVGMATFGYWYLIIIIPLFLVIFTMFDSLVFVKGDGTQVFSYLFFISFLPALNFFNDRHVFTFEFAYITRSYFEAVIFFLLLYKLIMMLSEFRFSSKYLKGIA